MPENSFFPVFPESKFNGTKLYLYVDIYNYVRAAHPELNTPTTIVRASSHGF